MSYYLKVDPENTLKGVIVEGLPPNNGLADKLYYEIPIGKVTTFESCMKFNCIDYTYHLDSEESVTYILPYSEFTFIDADILQFDPNLTFGRHIGELEEAIENLGRAVAIEISTHPKNQKELGEFLTANGIFFEFLQEDENRASYLISREEMNK